MPPRSAFRAFVARNTTLRPVPGADHARLHLTHDILAVWHALQLETGDPDTPLPYWAAAWAGGLALANYLHDHPDTVQGKRVFDLGSGSGLVAIAAMKSGASAATAGDIDPFAPAAIEMNAKANGVHVAVSNRDPLAAPPPDADVILAADCWYEQGFAARVTPWLRQAHEAGTEVFIGDPGRRYLPRDELTELAAYQVRTTTDLEDMDQKVGRVFAFTRYPLSEGDLS